MTHTQQDAVILAAKRRARRRSVTVEVNIDVYEDVTVYLDKIPLADLRAELRDREKNGDSKWTGGGELEDGYAEFTLEVARLESIRHLYLVGREAEASDKCRALLADLLGAALS